MKPILILTLGLLAAPALAQQSAEDVRANALITPMLQELAPGYHGQVLAACVVANAQPEEKAAMANAAGPSTEIGAIITAVINRPETVGCVEATLKQ
jgi:hypothetical protein